VNSEELAELRLQVEAQEAYPFKLFCKLHGFSPQLGYRLLAEGKIKTFRAGRKRLVSREAGAEFRRTLEAEAEG
jgi:hypothetical protein